MGFVLASCTIPPVHPQCPQLGPNPGEVAKPQTTGLVQWCLSPVGPGLLTFGVSDEPGRRQVKRVKSLSNPIPHEEANANQQGLTCQPQGLSMVCSPQCRPCSQGKSDLLP